MPQRLEMIVCVGWGSLVWNPGELPINGCWHHDGPELPLEFARHSGKAKGQEKLTLVVFEAGIPTVTRWARLKLSDLGEARAALRKREGCNLADIGYWPGGSSHAGGDRIAEWANAKDLQGVVWTALPANFADQRRAPTQDEAIAFLSELPEHSRLLAEEYVRKAPLVVQTPLRAAFEERFGWLPLARD